MKEFFRPTKGKIILFLILLIIFYLSSYQDYLTLNQKVSNEILRAVVNTLEPCPDNIKVCDNDRCYYQTSHCSTPLFSFIVTLIILILINFLLSCFIVFIVNKLKTK